MPYKLETCKICNKEFKNLAVHLRVTHKMARGKYDEQYDLGLEEPEDLMEVKDEVSRVEEIPKEEWVKPESESDKKEPQSLESFLSEYQITEVQLREFLRNTGNKSKGDVLGEIKIKASKAKIKAQELADSHRNKITTPSVEVAEVLVAEFGYTVTTVTSKPYKHWVLEI